MDKVLPRRMLCRHRVPFDSGQQSISINDQFRLCFIWKDGNATDVEIVDYH